jgi:hypothetical protein
MKRLLAISFFFIVLPIIVLVAGDAGGQQGPDTNGTSPMLQPPASYEGGTTMGAQSAAPGGYGRGSLSAETPDAVPATGPVPFGAGWTVPGPGGRTEHTGPPGGSNFPSGSGGSYPGTTSSGAFPGGSMSTTMGGSAGAGTGTGSTIGGSGTGSFGAGTPGMDRGTGR